MKRSKRGISLAFVIVVVMALMIFSAMLFSAASHSMSMTGESTDGRQAYLTAKSAIEYAKSVAYDQAKAGELKPFAVSQDAGGSFTDVPNIDPNLGIYKNLDGTTNYATCTNPGGDGISWKITARVKYRNSAQYRQLAYSFTVTPKNSLPASDFFLCGVRYGLQEVFFNGFYPVFFPESYSYFAYGTSAYPVVENLPVSAQSNNGYVHSPETFFWGMSQTSNYRVNGASILSENVKTTISSDLIGVAGDINGVFSDQTNRSYLFLNPYDDNTTVGGIIYFAGKNDGAYCTVSLSHPRRTVVKIKKGYYWFDSGVDLFDLKTSGMGFADSSAKRLVPLADDVAVPPAVQQKEKAYQQDVTFVEANAAKMISGDAWDTYKGLNWAPLGLLGAGWPSSQTYDGWWSHEDRVRTDDKTAYLYVKEGQTWAVRNQVDTYSAKQIFLQFVGDGLFSPWNISESNNFTLPNNGTVVFQGDLISMEMVKTDTDAGSDVYHRPAIVQPRYWAHETPAQFFLKSLNGTDNVTLAIPNDVGVYSYRYNGKSYESASYVIPKGIYSVKSGFNFFDGTITDWSAFWTACRTGNYPVGGNLSGGFTITPGKYSVS